MTQFPSSSFATILNGQKEHKGGAFTVRSKKTGKDYTFKVNSKPYNGRVYHHVKVETQYMEFQYLGFLSNDGKIVRKGQSVDSPSAVAASWVLAKIQNKDFGSLDTQVDMFHLGKCICCGRTLTDATSIELGIGPKCRAF